MCSAAPPIDSDEVGTGVSEGFADTGLNSPAAQSKNSAATIPAAILEARRSPSLNKMRSGADRRSITADYRVHELPQKTIDTQPSRAGKKQPDKTQRIQRFIELDEIVEATDVL